jgi:2-dehydropantoate 2-reductase
VEALSQMLVKAGFKAPVRTGIRDEIWVKLWGNLALNPLSALTASTLDRLAFRPELRAVVCAMMEEGAAVGEALGAKFAVTLDKRLDGAGEVGAHKTSMLQDLERGRPMEIDALLGAVVELGGLTNTRTPLCDAVLAMVRERARQAGCYPQ